MRPPSAGAGPRRGVALGVRRGWSSFLWVAKVLLPVSFLVALLQWTGWLQRAGGVLGPLMGLIGLPAEAALPILSGMIINLYAGIAAMAVLPFTEGQATLIAVFTLVAHNLIIEGAIQHRSGLGAAQATVVRIAAAVATVLLVAPFLGDASTAVSGVIEPAARGPFVAFLADWARAAALLLAKILAIIVVIMVLLEVARQMDWLGRVYALFKPLMAVLGLPSRAATLWATAAIFGLMYGGAVIMEEAGRSGLKKSELERLHVSIGINHSMLEDPTLFVALGLNGLYLWLPKLFVAALAVHTLRGLQHLSARARPS